MLTFSIVTPTLNASRFLNEAVQSVLSQQYNGLEYWVLDGGSTDETPRILNGYGNRLRWSAEDDLGQSAAINRGWEQAEGEILSWLNADDLLLPGAIETVSAYFEAHPEVDMVYGDCDYVNPEGAIHPAIPHPSLSLIPRWCGMPSITCHSPRFSCGGKSSSRIGPLDETLHYVMDFDYWLRVGLCCRVAYLPHKRLAAMRLHPAAKSIADLSQVCA